MYFQSRLKALDTNGITQNNYTHITLLGNEQWGAVANKTHCEKRLPLK